MVAFNTAIATKLENLATGLLKGHRIFKPGNDMAAMQRQFGRASKFPRGLTLSFSKNEEDLEQYYQIRKQGYREIMGLKHYDGRPDAVDAISQILIVKSGATVVGGARLTISSEASRRGLPMEFEQFRVSSIYPEIDLSNINYCEMSRLAVLPEFRTGEVMKEIAQAMLDYCLANNVQVGFAIATPIHARRFQRIFGHLGYGYVINEDIVVRKAVLEHSDTLFAAADFTPDQRYFNILKREESEVRTIFTEGLPQEDAIEATEKELVPA